MSVDWYPSQEYLRNCGHRRLRSAQWRYFKAAIPNLVPVLMLVGSVWLLFRVQGPLWLKVILEMMFLVCILAPVFILISVHYESVRDELRIDMRQARWLLRMSTMENRRTWILEHPFLLVLREFSPPLDYGVADIFRRNDGPPPDDIGEQLLSFSPTDRFRHDTMPLSRALNTTSLMVTALLNVDSPVIVPEWAAFIPTNASLWQRAAVHCIQRARGVLVIATRITESIAFELEELTQIPPEKVLVILDVEEIPPDAINRPWWSKCPPSLHSRTLPLGSPTLEQDVRNWIATLDSKQEA